ncbi:MAG TPA: MarR family transcriptional regulator [Kofleriaceae bacterium]|jgi:DNA-binding MarR family transcriptional regulator|nr:MarR family transcriptional regulator [Kofleriaceae bacterium]
MTRAGQHAEALRAAVSALVRRMRAESANQKYSWPQLVVLKRLETEGPMTTADLARAERIKPQTMGELIGDLEADELVLRRDDAADGRRRLVSITRAGSRAVTESRAERQSWLARAIETQLDADEQRALAGAIDILRKLSG